MSHFVNLFYAKYLILFYVMNIMFDGAGVRIQCEDSIGRRDSVSRRTDTARIQVGDSVMRPIEHPVRMAKERHIYTFFLRTVLQIQIACLDVIGVSMTDQHRFPLDQ